MPLNNSKRIRCHILSKRQTFDQFSIFLQAVDICEPLLVSASKIFNNYKTLTTIFPNMFYRSRRKYKKNKLILSKIQSHFFELNCLIFDYICIHLYIAYAYEYN